MTEHRNEEWCWCSEMRRPHGDFTFWTDAYGQGRRDGERGVLPVFDNLDGSVEARDYFRGYNSEGDIRAFLP